MNKKVFVSVIVFALAGLTASYAQTKPKGPKKAVDNTPKEVVVPKEISELLTKHTCFACHKPDTKLVGPAYTEVAKKKYTEEQIVELVHKPEPSHWPGYPPMSAMAHVPKEDILKIAKWINSLAKK